MTKVKIKKQNNVITEVEAKGHTGYNKNGEDVLCASLSGIIQTAALGLKNVVGIDVKIERNDKDAYFKFQLPNEVTNEERIKMDAILGTMLEGIIDLQQSYSKFIKLEVLENVY